jgi:aminopeptidase N
LTILYMENKYGADTARAMLMEDRDQVIRFTENNELPVVDNNPDFMELLNANSYQKGSWVLHMLKRQLGDSVFWKSIRKYYSLYGGKTAVTDDLRKVFENISGKDLKAFFQQWLYKPGIPALGIQWKYDAAGKKLLVTVKQERGLFEFPLEIGIRDRNRKLKTEKIRINQSSQDFSFPVNEKPVAIIPDPNVSLLFKAKVKEM